MAKSDSDPKYSVALARNILRFCLSLVVLFAILAGYYQASYEAETKKYLRLEDRYVRVREQLGRDETQRLIDESYDLEVFNY